MLSNCTFFERYTFMMNPKLLLNLHSHRLSWAILVIRIGNYYLQDIK
ncbi:hypothetical protein PEDI_49960 [Persicobacter diffluens]|uniref:Uncharacterized protein n=1 Tax=Persicobacter diffluens TaxID=981 RepID=A0AAN4W3Y7_9BACT|nr:hypothetical protein PEDI_49960 [Persicobacter diffluens]